MWHSLKNVQGLKCRTLVKWLHLLLEIILLLRCHQNSSSCSCLNINYNLTGDEPTIPVTATNEYG